MNKRYIIIGGVVLLFTVIVYISVTFVRIQRVNTDIESYLDQNFLNNNEEIAFQSYMEPFYVYAGFQSNKNTPVLYLYHYQNNDMKICSTSLKTHDDYTQDINYIYDKGNCRDYLFGSSGISYIVAKYDSDISLTYRFDSENIQVVEIKNFISENIVIFFYYGNIDTDESIILEDEEIMFN